jgi:hypothetical protein
MKMIKYVKKRTKPVTYSHMLTTLYAYELMHNVGMPENIAIRSLRDALNVYASEVHNGKEVLVSVAARGLPKSEVILEHGTPRTELTRMFIKAWQNNTLTEEIARNLMKKHWDIAHVTRAENQRLTDMGLRSKMMNSPMDRWNAAGIQF